jgi:endo-1,4-beta-xylanase
MVIKTMQKFGALGVDVYITEMDVDLHTINGTQEERWMYQAEVYRDMMLACLESSVCKGFATWGTSDVTSWITCKYDWCIKHPDGDPLLFDRDFNPKPAYFALQEALQTTPKALP